MTQVSSKENGSSGGNLKKSKKKLRRNSSKSSACSDLESGLDSPTVQNEGIDTGESKSSKRKQFQSRLKNEKMSLRQLDKFCKELETHFPDKNDTIYTSFETVRNQRVKKKRIPLETQMDGGNGPRNVRDWTDFVSKCKKELPADDKLVQTAVKKLQGRKVSHRTPIVETLQTDKDLTLRKLSQLERRAVAELPSDDVVIADIREAIKSREKSHKVALVARYTKLMKGKLKDMSVRSLNEFVKACETELDPDDALIAQARSACDARVMDKADPTKAKPVSRKKKESSNSRKEKLKEAPGDDVILNMAGAWKGPNPGDASVISSVAEEFSGVNDSISCKAFFIGAFLLFAYIMVSSMQLVIKIAPFLMFDEKTSSATSSVEPVSTASAEH